MQWTFRERPAVRAPPKLISKQFLGIWPPATHVCCCRSVPLYQGVKILMKIGVFSALISILDGLGLLGTGKTASGLLQLFIAIMELFLYLKAYYSTRDFKIKTLKVVLIGFVILPFLYYIQIIGDYFLKHQDQLSAIFETFFLVWFLYTIYISWSFIVRVEADDFETVVFGPIRQNEDRFTPTAEVQLSSEGSQAVAESQNVHNQVITPIGCPVELTEGDAHVITPMRTIEVIPTRHSETEVSDSS